MSVIFQGDTVSNFGTFLPAPYIRKATVNDTSIDVELSIFLNVNESQNVEEMISFIGNKLYFYIHYTVDPNRQEKIIEGEKNPFSYYGVALPSLEEPGVNWSDGFIQIEDVFDVTVSQVSADADVVFTYTNLVDNTQVDAEGNTIWEFRVSRTLELGSMLEQHSIANMWYSSVVTGYGTEPGYEYLEDESLLVDETAGTSSERGLYINAFSSMIDASVTGVLENEKLNQTLMNAKMSQISYQTVLSGIYYDFDAGQYNIYDIAADDIFPFDSLPTNVQTELIDSKGAIYSQIPLQSLQSPFYTIVNITHTEVVEYFQELVTEFQTRAKNDKMLKNILDNVSVILTTSGGKANILVRLNKLRTAFPSKSSATKTGQFYTRFRDRIYTVNKRIQEGDTLTPIQAKNPKVVDARTVSDANWEAPAWVDPADIYPSLTTDYIYNTWFVTAEYDDYSNIYANYGFWFFDYEKALRTNSQIAAMVDVSKLESLLGIRFPYEYFQVTSATIRRKVEYDVADSYAYITANGATMSMGLDPWGPYTAEIAGDNQADSADDLLVDVEEAISDTATTEGTSAARTDGVIGFQDLVPAMVARHFIPYDIVSDPSSAIENYRLIMYEFQDYWKGEDSTADSYGAKVEIYDKSAYIMTALIDYYRKTLENFQSYVLMATEQCTVNSSTEEFNSFFTDALMAQYEDNLANAPWNIAPLLYNLHRDLVFDAFGGDRDKIISATTDIINTINPYNGTLTNIRGFFERMSEFNNSQYNQGSNTSLPAIPGTIGYLLSNFEDGYVVYDLENTQGDTWPPRVTTKVAHTIEAGGGDCVVQGDDSVHLANYLAAGGSAADLAADSQDWPDDLYMVVYSSDPVEYDDTGALASTGDADNITATTYGMTYSGNNYNSTGEQAFTYDYDNDNGVLHADLAEAFSNGDLGEYGAICFMYTGYSDYEPEEVETATDTDDPLTETNTTTTTTDLCGTVDGVVDESYIESNCIGVISSDGTTLSGAFMWCNVNDNPGQTSAISYDESELIWEKYWLAAWADGYDASDVWDHDPTGQEVYNAGGHDIQVMTTTYDDRQAPFVKNDYFAMYWSCAEQKCKCQANDQLLAASTGASLVVDVDGDGLSNDYVALSSTFETTWDAIPVSVICTELERQGLLPSKVLLADALFGGILRKNYPDIYRGYCIFGHPIVKKMQTSRTITRRALSLVLPFTRHISGDKNVIGALVKWSGMAICQVIGKLNRFKFKKSAYLLAKAVGNFLTIGHQFHKPHKEENYEEIFQHEPNEKQELYQEPKKRKCSSRRNERQSQR